MAKKSNTPPLERVLVTLFWDAVSIFGGTGIMMLFLGSVHDEDARVPALGYWNVLSLTVAAWLVFTLWTATREAIKEY